MRQNTTSAILKSISALAGLAALIMLPYHLWGINILSSFIVTMKLPVPMWITAFLVSLLTLIIIAALKVRVIRTRCNAVFASYTEDVFDDRLYRWEYVRVRSKYSIGKITVYCGKCKYPLIDRECHQCGAVFIDKMSRGHVEARIRYNIETKFQINEFMELESDSNV